MTTSRANRDISYFTRQESPDNMTFRGEWGDDGVFFYQAYNDEIADWSVEHQKLGGPLFKPTRMTWIKPSFAWMLYRAGYGAKDNNQNRILKIKLSHESVAELLSGCSLSHHGANNKGKQQANNPPLGRVQWDPERDIMFPDEAAGRTLRRMPNTRAIQIGLKGELSERYVNSIVSIEDVTDLARTVGEAHDKMRVAQQDLEAMNDIIPHLPHERPYLPACSNEVLKDLLMISEGTVCGEQQEEGMQNG
jgi:hypothetical protein